MLNHLRRVTRENQDLETETASLRETLEKLKYDLAHYRCSNDDKEMILAETNAHTAQLDSKYQKAIDEIHVLQLTVSNMQQEIDYLRRICHQVE